MRIERFEVTGFLGRTDSVSADFNSDLNILTGKNGSGKTSLLKLMWYIMSGNILLALREIDFQKATLTTSEYTCTVIRTGPIYCKVEVVTSDWARIFEDLVSEDGDIEVNAEDEAGRYLEETGRSIFLPTFRRIEGGFGLQPRVIRSVNLASRTNRKNAIEDALEDLSRRLTNSDHVFVAAISTMDIVGLLQGRYTNLSEESAREQETTSKDIIDTIRKYYLEGDQGVETANKLLDGIRKRIEASELSRADKLRPISAVGDVVNSLLQHKGIKLGRLNFGDAADAISSDLLSAGEKQMLSFIAYNGLNDHAIMFIDEPELSLHVDWQRQLFTTLTEQQSTNQFILATHSPFIYGKYPDKEIQISLDRGDCEENDQAGSVNEIKDSIED